MSLTAIEASQHAVDKLQSNPPVKYSNNILTAVVDLGFCCVGGAENFKGAQNSLIL